MSSIGNLVVRAIDSDADAWDQIVDQMNNMVWSVVRSFRLSEADSHDAAQMSWLRAIEGLKNVRDPDRFGLWIATITRRECMRVIEHSSRLNPVDPVDGFGGLHSDAAIPEQIVDRDEVERILAALERVSPNCQAILRLVLCDPPMTYEAISEALGIAVGTIGPRRGRCVRELRTASRL